MLEKKKKLLADATFFLHKVFKLVPGFSPNTPWDSWKPIGLKPFLFYYIHSYIFKKYGEFNSCSSISWCKWGKHNLIPLCLGTFGWMSLLIQYNNNNIVLSLLSYPSVISCLVCVIPNFMKLEGRGKDLILAETVFLWFYLGFFLYGMNQNSPFWPGTQNMLFCATFIKFSWKVSS